MKDDEKKLIAEVKSLCRAADLLLWESYAFSPGGKGPDVPAPGSDLVFPDHGAGRRIGDQEARFAFANAVATSDPRGLLYSLETPVESRYSFSGLFGKTERSAPAVLSLYRAGRTDKLAVPDLNVEFQSGRQTPLGRTLKYPKKISPIVKGIEKLLREEPSGLWFHLLDDADKRTLKDLFRTFSESIYCVQGHHDDIGEKTLLFHVCCLKMRFSVQRAFRAEANTGIDLTHASFQFESPVNANRPVDGMALHGWKVHRRSGN